MTTGTEPTNPVLRVSPAEFSRMQERSLHDPEGFEYELDYLRRKRGWLPGTEVTVEVVP